MQVFVVLLAVISASLPGLAASVKPAVSQHFPDLATKAKALSASISNIPNTGGTPKQAEIIHKEAMNLINHFQNASTAVPTSFKFSKADSLSIMKDVQAFRPLLLDAFSAMLMKKQALQNTAATIPKFWETLVADVHQLGTASDALGVNLLAAAHPDIAPDASDVCADPDGPDDPGKMTIVKDALLAFPL